MTEAVQRLVDDKSLPRSGITVSNPINPQANFAKMSDTMEVIVTE